VAVGMNFALKGQAKKYKKSNIWTVKVPLHLVREKGKEIMELNERRKYKAPPQRGYSKGAYYSCLADVSDIKIKSQTLSVSDRYTFKRCNKMRPKDYMNKKRLRRESLKIQAYFKQAETVFCIIRRMRQNAANSFIETERRPKLLGKLWTFYTMYKKKAKSSMKALLISKYIKYAIDSITTGILISRFSFICKTSKLRLWER
jgi:hypothetical protein